MVLLTLPDEELLEDVLLDDELELVEEELLEELVDEELEELLEELELPHPTTPLHGSATPSTKYILSM